MEPLLELAGEMAVRGADMVVFCLQVAVAVTRNLTVSSKVWTVRTLTFSVGTRTDHPVHPLPGGMEGRPALVGGRQ